MIKWLLIIVLFAVSFGKIDDANYNAKVDLIYSSVEGLLWNRKGNWYYNAYPIKSLRGEHYESYVCNFQLYITGEKDIIGKPKLKDFLMMKISLLKKDVDNSNKKRKERVLEYFYLQHPHKKIKESNVLGEKIKRDKKIKGKQGTFSLLEKEGEVHAVEFQKI